MNQFAYYSEPPAVFEGYAGPVVPSHMVYNGFGEPVGAIPLLAALVPLVAKLFGSLFKRGSATNSVNGLGEYDGGLGLYAGLEVVPSQIVVNGLGEPVGAIPLLAALAPLAAKAAGFLAPLAAGAAGAIVPLATQASSAASPLLQNLVAQALPGLTSSLPGLLRSLPPPPFPAMVMPGGGGPPPMPGMPGMMPGPGGGRRRRRRRGGRLGEVWGW